jgi:hypothetical protein
MKWPRVTSRPARLDEIPYLQQRLAQPSSYCYENHDLSKCLVYVVEYDGAIVGLSAARLQWQIEPVMLFPEFHEHGPHFAQKHATFLLIRELHDWISDRERNLTGVYSYFCYILKQRMQKLAVNFGMQRWYAARGGKFFGRVV